MLHHDDNFSQSSHQAVCLQTALFPPCNVCLHIAWFVFKAHCPHPLFRSPSRSCCHHLSSLQTVRITYATPAHCLVCLRVTLFVFTPSLSDHTVHAPHSRTRRGTNFIRARRAASFPWRSPRPQCHCPSGRRWAWRWCRRENTGTAAVVGGTCHRSPQT